MKKDARKTIKPVITIVLFLTFITIGAGFSAYAAGETEIPKEGAVYTLTYPDQTAVTENAAGEPLTYEDVENALQTENWRLLGSGYTTDENGEIVLPGAWENGTIHIVETKVPAGYTPGAASEVTAELSDKSATFVNPKEAPAEEQTGTEDQTGSEEPIGTEEQPKEQGGSEEQPAEQAPAAETPVPAVQEKNSAVPEEPETPAAAPETAAPANTGRIIPDTGDGNALSIWGIVLTAAILSLALFNDRRRKVSIHAVGTADRNGGGSARTGSAGKMLLLVLAVVSAAWAALAVHAAEGFTIRKVDDQGNPVAGAVFDVYGKPEVSWEAIPDETMDITLVKTWDDADNQDSYRPTAEAYKDIVTLWYTLDGSDEKTTVTDPAPVVTDNGDNTYTVQWTGVKKQEDNGAVRNFGVSEGAVERYEPGTITGDAENGYQLVNTYNPPQSIGFDCDAFIRVLRTFGTESVETDTYPSSREIGVTIGDQAATAEQIAALIENAAYEKYDFHTGEFAAIEGTGSDYFALEVSGGTDAPKLKITSHSYCIVKITFTYEGASYTQLVCTPGDVTGDDIMSLEDARVLTLYLNGALVGDEELDLDFSYEGYDLFQIMGDMRVPDIADVEINLADPRMIRSIVNGVYG